MIKLGRRDGFTLVELSIVVLVIGILISAVMPSFARTRSRTMRSSCVSNQKHLLDAATLYASDHGTTDEVLSSETLFDEGRITPGLSECPLSENVDHDDYEITIEDGRVVSIRCLIDAVGHEWEP